jgi:hypothetical protein
LTEAAFQFFLALGLTRAAKKIDQADWVESVMAKTWQPFAKPLSKKRRWLNTTFFLFSFTYHERQLSMWRYDN